MVSYISAFNRIFMHAHRSPEIAQQHYFKLQVEIGVSIITGEDLKKAMNFMDDMHHIPLEKWTLVQKTKYDSAQKIVVGINTTINQQFSKAINEDKEFRLGFIDQVARMVEKSKAYFEKQNDLLFRGIQILGNSDYAYPKIQFNEIVVPVMGSLGKRHHDGPGYVSPRIVDPCDATQEEKDNNKQCWTRGVISSSADFMRAAMFAIAAFSGKGRTDGYIYLYRPSSAISMAKHMYRELTDKETQMARTAYESVTPLVYPGDYVAAIRLSKEGILYDMEWNPYAREEDVKYVKERISGDSVLKAFVQEKTNYFALLENYHQKDQKVLQEFENKLPETFEEHKHRWNNRRPPS